MWIRDEGVMSMIEKIKNLEIIQRALDDFAKVQRRMILAKKENAVETYEDLKNEYKTLKALLNVSGVNLTELDEIKE